MKKLTIFTFLLCLFQLFFSTNLQAQDKLRFLYDTSGNRTDREIVMTRSISPDEQHVEPLNERLGEYTVRIYPNPTKGELVIAINSDDGVSCSGNLILYNMNGQTLKTIEIQSHSTRLDISDFPSGIYGILLDVGGAKSSWKIIKE